MNNIFNNTQIAFALKSDTELDRAYFLFKLINSQPLVRIGTAVTNFAIKANLPVESLIRATVFEHFFGVLNKGLWYVFYRFCVRVKGKSIFYIIFVNPSQ